MTYSGISDGPAVGKRSPLSSLLPLGLLCGALCTSPALADYAAPVAVHTFIGVANGQEPNTKLIQASDGNFYGTTSIGGANNVGTLFELTPAGRVTTLHSFDLNGYEPSAVVQGTDGSFYGTTQYGGSYGFGIAYKYTPGTGFTQLHSFDGTDAHYASTLIQADDGNFYGTSQIGGSSHLGNIFKMSPDGSVSQLHAFSYAEGQYPKAALIQASDGYLYGSVTYGGTSSTCGSNGCGYGTLFKIGKSGDFTRLYAFNGSDGANPYAALMQASDGALYGTTAFGGSIDAVDGGTVFKLTTSGAFTSLHSFDYVYGSQNGESPTTALAQGSDGKLYGTTLDFNVLSGSGTVYQISTSGDFTELFTENRVTGDRPTGQLILGSDGSLYGNNFNDGLASEKGMGNIYKFSVQPGTPPAPPLRIAVIPKTIQPQQSAKISWSSDYAGGCQASGAPWSGSQQNTIPTSGLQTVAPTTPGQYTYTLTCSNAGGTSTASAVLTVTQGTGGN